MERGFWQQEMARVCSFLVGKPPRNMREGANAMDARPRWVALTQVVPIFHWSAPGSWEWISVSRDPLSSLGCDGRTTHLALGSDTRTLHQSLDCEETT